MLFTQSYARRSSATVGTGSLGLDLATEQGRPPVRLHATMLDSPSYARLMLTLYNVVTSNLAPPQRDHSAYQAWVGERYLEELTTQQAQAAVTLPRLFEQRGLLKSRVKEIDGAVTALTRTAQNGDYWFAVRTYYDYLYKYDRDAWYALDPVVSVHPDCLIFEAFSQDESSYGRVTVPTDRLRVDGAVAYGTTNIDFSPDLAREIGRVRSYRATALHVEQGAVALATAAGAVVEKKIDLPPTWVRGFLQVQSAATLPGVDVRLSTSTLADVLSVLRRQREDKGPRSLRVVLEPGKRPSIVIEPWGIVIHEHTFVHDGRSAQEIRLWGRRRLLVLSDLLAHGDEVRARLLGTGLPSYWTVWDGASRIDVGLSGWTQNDWSRAAQFDLLTAGEPPAPAVQAKAARMMEECLVATPEDVALGTDLDRPTATAALQALCREGRVMYDHTTASYRWRQLFPVMPEPETVAPYPRLTAARRLIEKRAVTWSEPPRKNVSAGFPAPSASGQIAAGPQWRTFVQKNGTSDKFWNILLTGSSHVVHFGRNGTDGQRQQKEFDTLAAAKTSYDKLVKEKTTKGYKETTPPPPPVAAPASAPTAGDVAPTGERTRYTANVRGEKIFEVVLDRDTDGRVVYAQCSCGTFRRDKLRKGPCPHILAVSLTAAREEGNTARPLDAVGTAQ